MWFQRAWNKLIRNIELYLGILTATIVAILGIFEVVNLEIVTGVVLSLLGLLAVEIIKEREDREATQSSIEHISQLVARLSSGDLLSSWNQHESEFVSRLERAKTYRLLAVGPIRLLKQYKQELLDVLGYEDGQVRILLMDPDGGAIQIAKIFRPESLSDTRVCLNHYIPRIAASCVIKDRLQVRTLDYVPPYIISVIDGDQDNGVIITTLASIGQTDPMRPSMKLHKKDGDLYTFFCREFEELWRMGTDYCIQEA